MIKSSADRANFFNKPLKVNGKEFYPSRIMPGPMEGAMNPLYCRAMNRLGWLDGWITPFLRLTEGVPRPKRLAHFLNSFTDSKRPVIVQLMGTDADLMGKTAKVIYQLNSEDVKIHGFDLNCACPSRTVLKNGSGGTLLRNPKLIAKMVRSIKKELPDVPVDVKIRTGFKSPTEMNEIIPRLTDAGADLLHIHFRTVKENYLPTEGREERLTKAVELAGEIPVFASGNIYTVADAVKVVNETACAGVLAARGLLKDPYLIQRVKSEETLSDDMRMTFYKMLLEVASELSRCKGKGAFMEQAAWMFGPKDPFFKKIAPLSVEELLSLKL